jgi:hypothetical protein
MPTATFYLDSDDFITASSVYSDIMLTVLAPDGLYQDCGVFRFQSNGVLGAPTTCPVCKEDCSSSTGYLISEQGVYTIQVDLGTGVGDVEVTFPASTNAKKIEVLYAGVLFYLDPILFGPQVGYYSATNPLSPAIQEPYIQVTGDCDIVASTPVNVPNYSWNPTSSAFEQVGTTPSYVAAATASDVSIIPSTDDFIFRFSKGFADITNALVTITAPCKGTTGAIKVLCPKEYVQYDFTAPNPATPCTDPRPNNKYIAQADPVAAPLVGEFVFDDTNGNVYYNVASETYGILNATTGRYEIDVQYGRIQSVTVCP